MAFSNSPRGRQIDDFIVDKRGIAVKYLGHGFRAEIPEGVRVASPDIFDKQYMDVDGPVATLQELTMQHPLQITGAISFLSFDAPKAFSQVETITFNPPGDIKIEIDLYLKQFPNLKHLNINFQTPHVFVLEYNRAIECAASERDIQINVSGAKQITDCGRSGHCRYHLNFSGTSMGRVTGFIRVCLIEDIFERTELLPEEQVEHCKSWIKANGKSVYKTLLDWERTDILAKILACKEIRWPLSVYEALLEEKDIKDNVELKSAVMSSCKQHHNMAKANEKKNNEELKDLIEPERRHAMKKVWGWTENHDGSICITAYKSQEPVADLFVPDKICGKTVTEIGPNAFKWCKATAITVPESVSKIGASAFYGCKNLTTLNILGHVKVIPSCMCFDDTSLKTLIIPDDVDVIGRDAFRNTSLTSLPAPSAKYIGQQAFSNTNIRKLDMHNTILDKCAFLGCPYLVSVTISSDYPTVIPDQAFSSCRALKSLELHGVVSIGDKAFEDCCQLETVFFHSPVDTMGLWSFGNLLTIKKVYYTSKWERKNLLTRFDHAELIQV